MLLEVARGADDDEPEGVRQPNANHVALDELAQPNAGVKALSDDVDASVLEDELELDAGMTLTELRQEWLDHEVKPGPRHGQSQAADDFTRFRG